MSLSVPLEIAREIAGYCYYNWETTRRPLDQDAYTNSWWTAYSPKPLDPSKPFPDEHFDDSLLQLRATTRIFRIAVDELLFRAIKVNNISPKSLARIKGLLDSPSIRCSIQEYRFAPQQCTWRPVVGLNEYSYSKEYYKRGGIVDHKPTTFMEMHKRRIAGAKFFDEQVKLVPGDRHDDEETGWFTKTFNRLFRQREADVLVSRLYELPYLGRLGDLSNLTYLYFGYRQNHNYDSDWSKRWTPRNDMSAGLGMALASSLPRLNRLTIDLVTLTDLENICHAVTVSQKQQDAVRLTSIKCLEILIEQDFVVNRQGMFIAFYPIQSHINRGRAISDLLGFFPGLEDLKISTSDHCPELLVQDFDPPVLPHLQSISLDRFCMTFSALWKLTIGDEKTATVRLRTASFGEISLIKDDSGDWAKMFTAWADRCQQPWQTEPSRYPRFQFGKNRYSWYLDSIILTEKIPRFDNVIPFPSSTVSWDTDKDMAVLDKYFVKNDNDYLWTCWKDGGDIGDQALKKPHYRLRF